jgi:hypothetical protein
METTVKQMVQGTTECQVGGDFAVSQVVDGELGRAFLHPEIHVQRFNFSQQALRANRGPGNQHAHGEPAKPGIPDRGLKLHEHPRRRLDRR